MKHDPRKPPRSFWLWLKRHKLIGGGCLLFSFLFLASLLVPFASPYSLDVVNAEAANLPAKMMEVGQGAFDGTGLVKGVLFDPATGNPAFAEGEENYPSFAILGAKNNYERTSDELSETVKAYGRGGALRLSLLRYGQEGAIRSPSFTFDAQDDYALDIEFDASASSSLGHSPSYALFLRADFHEDNTYDSVIPLSLYSRSYESLSLTSELMKTAVRNSPSYQTAGKSRFSAYPELRLQAVEEGDLPSLYIRSFHWTSHLEPARFDRFVSFDDATRMLASFSAWSVRGEAEKGIYQSRLSYGDFRFDYYGRAFGYRDSGFVERVLSEKEIDDFRQRGYLRYDWQRKNSTDGASFALLDEEHCPLRSFKEERYDGVTSSLVGLVSPYRYQYYKGYLPTCAPPAYFFGTNGEGKDFAKLLFAGLASSYAFAFALTAFGLLGAYFLGLVWSYHEESKPARRRFYFLLSSGFYALTFSLLVYSSRSLFGLFLLSGGVLVWGLSAILLCAHLIKKGGGAKLWRRSEPILPPRFDSLAAPGLLLFPAALLMEGVGAALCPPLLTALDYPSLASGFVEAGAVLLLNSLPLALSLTLLFDTLLSLALLFSGLYRLFFARSDAADLPFEEIPKLHPGN